MPPARRPSSSANPLLRKVGPAPLWLWLIAGLVGLYAIYRLRGAGGSKAPASQFPALQPSGLSYTPPTDSGGGGGISGIPPDSATADGTAAAYPGGFSPVISLDEAGAGTTTGLQGSALDTGTTSSYLAPAYEGPGGGLVVPTTYQALGVEPEPITSGMVAPPDLTFIEPVTPPAWTPANLPPPAPSTWTPDNIQPWTGATFTTTPAPAPPPTPSTTGADRRTYGGVLSPEWTG